jgi:hypothetical protein
LNSGNKEELVGTIELTEAEARFLMAALARIGYTDSEFCRACEHLSELTKCTEICSTVGIERKLKAMLHPGAIYPPGYCSGCGLMPGERHKIGCSKALVTENNSRCSYFDQEDDLA